MEASRWLVTLSEVGPDDPCHQNWQDWLASSPANFAAWNDVKRSDSLLREALAVMPATQSPNLWRKRVCWAALGAMAAALAVIAMPGLLVRLQA